MKVSGFTFIRNAIKYDYPILEAIRSILPLCDEVIVAVGNSEDDTLQLIQSIDPKVKIIETVWDDSVREGGRTLALETDKAYAAISKDSDWAFYIQGDEILHEQYYPAIKASMLKYKDKPSIDGLLFNYLHFYGSYDYVGSSISWYPDEIRIIRVRKDIFSYRDAQGFRKQPNEKLNVKRIDAWMYHYGWVKPPTGLNQKVRNFTQFYHDDAWLAENVPADYEFDFGNAERLTRFTGTHPNVSLSRIKAQNWDFDFDPAVLRSKMSLRRKVLQKIADWTGWRIGEYKNYQRI